MAAIVEASDVEQGFVQPPQVLLGYRWDAQAAEIHSDEGYSVELPERCLIYLGQANGFAAIYDPPDRFILAPPHRLPRDPDRRRTSSVEVVPDDCPTQ